MIARFAARLFRPAGARPLVTNAEGEIRSFLALLGQLALFARIGGQIVRGSGEER